MPITKFDEERGYEVAYSTDVENAEMVANAEAAMAKAVEARRVEIENSKTMGMGILILVIAVLVVGFIFLLDHRSSSSDQQVIEYSNN